MFNFGKENFGGHEQVDKFKKGDEMLMKAFDDCCDGGLEERLKNNQDTNS